MESAVELKESDVRAENEALKLELERLHRELAQTSHEKIQSAQYGLVLLDEKQALQQRCDEIEAIYDTTKHELEILKEALAKVQTSQKVSTTTGIEQEESLLQETATKEASLTSSLQELEKELKQVRQELSRVLAEKERLQSENYEISKHGDVSDWERKNLRSELKDMKLREQRLLTDNNELEEENISLQKQVSSLRSSQVEFEGAKHEVRRLKEEVESLNAQLEELGSLRRIGEQQLEEALEALQSEREQKYALRRELDQRLTAESPVFHLDGLSFAGFRLGSKPPPSPPPPTLSRVSPGRPPACQLCYNSVEGGSGRGRCAKGACGAVSKSVFSPCRSASRSLRVGCVSCHPSCRSVPSSCVCCNVGSRCAVNGGSTGPTTSSAVTPCLVGDTNSSLDSGLGSDASPCSCRCDGCHRWDFSPRWVGGQACRSASCPAEREVAQFLAGLPDEARGCGYDRCPCVVEETGERNVETAVYKPLSANGVGVERNCGEKGPGGLPCICSEAGTSLCACEQGRTKGIPSCGSRARRLRSSSQKRARSLSQPGRKDFAFLEKVSYRRGTPVTAARHRTSSETSFKTHVPAGSTLSVDETNQEKGNLKSQIAGHDATDALDSPQPVDLSCATKKRVDSGALAADSDEKDALRKFIFEGSYSSVSSISPTDCDDVAAVDWWPCSASTEGSVIGAYLPHQRPAVSESSAATSEVAKRHSWRCKGRKMATRISCAMVDYVFAP
ncbi:hypothetical protein HPB48_021566 [Haemaphysalis longicornis]|uniref:Uncharacterized protein n=1 Tax=Haemaphysalis longicornis TaxID=44386 RepID=A0A9J6G823_HAELO|nr:hypothetical protein HPB48_021566 [Haemaphysalis longicornis]